ncbi:MAG TPA: CBS domain-containing protein [Pirellulales bacterium]|nr:CBS domain-containing protein [Pirellulales bacterium]
MLSCPFCGEEIIEGADACDVCQQPLEFMSKPRPGSTIERSLVKGRIHQLSPHAPTVVEANAPVGDVLKLMVERSIGCVVVVTRGDVVGIFSERDALDRLNADFAGLAGRPVAEFMTASPETVESDARIAFALHKMDVGGYRHLPVLSGRKISGVISVRDILRYITDELVAIEVSP